MTLIFLNRFFYPDHSATSQMLSDLAFALADVGNGHRVRVITSRQRYDAPCEHLPARETIQGVEIHRVWTTRFGRDNLVGRAFDYLTFYISAALMLAYFARRGDIVVAKTDPPMLSVVAAPIAGARGAKLVNWLQDIFPEVAEALDVGGGRALKASFGIMRWLRTRSLKFAAMNIVLGELMEARIQRLGVETNHIRIIPNWADGTLLKPVEPAGNALRVGWNLTDAFVVGYSGNLGRAHEYATLLDAIEELESGLVAVATARASTALNDPRLTTPNIVWLFIGGGALYEAFKRDVASRGLKSVRFEPYQPRDRLAESLSLADIHLVSLKPVLEGLIVPSKFYGVAAVGRPTIFIGDHEGEIAQLLRHHNCGVTVADGDGAALARAVLEFAADPALCQRMGANARRTFETVFDKAIAVARWQTLLRDIAV